MKRFFEKEWVAWTVLGICVIFAIVVGQSKAPKLVSDESGLVMNRTVKKIEEYNETWQKKYDTSVALMVVEDEDHKSMVKMANKRFDKLDLDDNDAVLIVCLDSCEYYFASGENFAVLLSDDSFQENTELYFERARADGKGSPKSNFEDNIDQVLYEYYGYVDVLFRSGMTPKTASAASALSSGIEALTEGVGSMINGTAGVIGNIVGWSFGVVGKVLKWVFSLGTFGTIVVIWLCIRFVKKRKGM